MLNNLKALLIVLPLAILVFLIAKPVCLQFMTEQDFKRRRNIWIALTITAFASPSFWVFAGIAAAVLVWGTRKDQNPLALYAMTLFVIPQVGQQLPTIGINQLFELDSFRLLAFFILLPTALRLRKQPSSENSPDFKTIDRLLVAYVVLQLLLLMPYETITNTLRRGFLLSIDMWLIYYVASRTAASKNALVEVMAMFCVTCAILAPLALFESLKGWLLYNGLGTLWGDNILFAYLKRGDNLRAQVATGHSLTLGAMMALALGFWLYLSSKIRTVTKKVLAPLWLLMGLYASHARAPGLAAVITLFTFMGLGPKGFVRLLLAAIASVVIGVTAIAILPGGDSLLDSVPLGGNTNDRNVEYRIRLAEFSWQLILQNPFFGNPHFLKHMEELRQGQGIIDLLNQYMNVALLYGFTGLALFIAPFLAGIYGAYAQVRQYASTDDDMVVLGRSLLACFLTTLALIASQGFGSGQIFYMLVGLVVGYSRIAVTKPVDATPQEAASATNTAIPKINAGRTGGRLPTPRRT